ncbi:MAG: type II toxin-antitoxin system RelE/ParE family toxin [Gammaproteobacteria bacterium]|nr:MAG: type II toxin-antitoxin system RelE/ParE family toxin [Gammaproteobacteria bacterium]RLA60883.1 MAG: type II toxin-antitoxin system RelE/ParE family toxin [Gammaproteobacteria bacterium]
MSYTVRLREEAEFDLTEAAEWYERQRDGLGHEFLDEVLSTLDAIRIEPQSYPLVHRKTHRALVSRFPFAVFYRVQSSDIVVVSVMHGSRHPARWQNRT